MNSDCRAARDAIAHVRTIDDLPEEARLHAAECPRCRLDLKTLSALGPLTARARDALDAAPGLTPSAWVRIRAAAEGTPRRRRWGAWHVVAATAAVLLVGVSAWWVSTPSTAPPTAIDARGVATGAPADVGAHRVAVAPAAVEAGRRLEIAAGAILESERERTIAAFGRHTITLAPGTRLRVVRWQRAGVVLDLERGGVTSEVRRRGDEDRYEVRSGSIAARVVGTRFTVSRAEDGRTTVSVARGRVEVASGGTAERVLAAGESWTDLAGSEADAAGASDEGDDGARDTAGARAASHRVTTIDVPDQAMGAGGADAVDLTESLRAIMSAMRAGRCDSALKALAAVADELGPDHGDARIHWMAAWCHRALGADAESERLFERYRRAAPEAAWPLPRDARDLPDLPRAL